MIAGKGISFQKLDSDHPVYEFGLVGYPLGHSLSPIIHEAALRSLSLQGTYRLFPIPPGDEGVPVLKQLLQKVRLDKIQGLNITIPHKIGIVSYLDYLTPNAAAIGSVNTVYMDGLKLVGDNTDGQGFWSDIVKNQGFIGEKDGKCLVLGAGGSARAVIFALLDAGLDVTIAARRVEQAVEIRNQFIDCRHKIIVREWDDISEVVADSILIVNSTPLGMHPNSQISPWPNNCPFPKGAMVYDLVYNPLETSLVKEARKHGLNAVGGLGMLVEQAVLSFQCWTGLSAPREVMRKAAYG